MNNSPSGKVANPKLTLYAFHLRQSLAQAPGTQHTDVWLKYQELGKKLGIPKLEELPGLISTKISQQPNLQGEILGTLPFTAIPPQKQLHLTGEVNPLLIHDTFAVDLTLRYARQKVEIADLKGLNPENCLLPSNINASLGQTLVLFAQPVGNIQNEKDFADTCVTALISAETVKNLNLTCQAQGKLLGSPIFEYNNDSDTLKEQCHILIWLNTDSKTTQLEEAGDYYYSLIDLLLCRSKIRYARSEAIWCYQQAREIYSQLESKVIEFNQAKNKPLDFQLQQFKRWMKEIPETSLKYARHLRDLQLHRTTIQTNSKNYRLYLDKIKKICIQTDDLEFFSNFLELAENTFVEQINTDLAYLTPGQNLFDQMINTIRGIVEIEQAERDRQKEATDKIRDAKLQNTIQAVGIGLGVGTGVAGIFSQTFPLIIEKKWTLPSEDYPLLPPHPFLISFPLSLLLGAFLGWQAWRYSRKHLDRKLHPEALSISNPSSLPPAQNHEFIAPPPQKTGQKVEGSASLDN